MIADHKTEGEILLERVKEYLGCGGLFNPELVKHDKVRDLVIDLSKYVKAKEAIRPAALAI